MTNEIAIGVSLGIAVFILLVLLRPRSKFLQRIIRPAADSDPIVSDEPKAKDLAKQNGLDERAVERWLRRWRRKG